MNSEETLSPSLQRKLLALKANGIRVREVVSQPSLNKWVIEWVAENQRHREIIPGFPYYNTSYIQTIIAAFKLIELHQKTSDEPES